MLYEVNGDLVKDKQCDIFCHQVNCKATMGAGIARQISLAYPEVVLPYYDLCFEGNALGKVLYAKTKDNRYCVHMFAQDGYGHDKVYTDYDAFDSCLGHLKKKLLISDSKFKVGFPYRIGCGMAGGDWDIVYPKLKKLSEEIKQDVYIVKKGM